MSNKISKAASAKTVLVRKYRFVLFIISLLVLFATLGYFAFQKNRVNACEPVQNLEEKALYVNNKTLTAEVAVTEEQKQIGLSGRSCLGEDRVMVFSYNVPGNYCFWMKDMNFSIDMVWLDSDKKVITVKSGINPDTYPQTFCPSSSAMYVVEVSSGVSEKFGWQTGTIFSFD